MIIYSYADSLSARPALRGDMFRDRADQFRQRLGWDVSVDENGYETDEYDRINPMYIIATSPDGRHAGSLRILPTLGRTMVNDHFRHLADGKPIQSPLIWECTRFCLSSRRAPNAAQVPAAMMLAGIELGLRVGIEHWVGVFDARMIRIYRRLGWEPEVLGEAGEGRDKVMLGIWPTTEAVRDEICARSGLTPQMAEAWYDAAFPDQSVPVEQVA